MVMLRTQRRGNAERGEGLLVTRGWNSGVAPALFWNFRSVVRATSTEIK
jgi:hypothetical protein